MTKKIELTQGLFAVVDDSDYEELTRFRWHPRRSRGTYYAQRADFSKGRRRTICMHRQITGAQRGEIVDHINGDGLDNRNANLRLCTAQQNAANIQKLAESALSQRGVTPVTEKSGAVRYRAQIALHGVKYALGRYDTIEAAALAYDLASALANREFAVLNAPDNAFLILKAAGVLPPESLSPVELQRLEIVRRLEDGEPVRSIAAALGITRSAVKGVSHRRKAA